MIFETRGVTPWRIFLTLYTQLGGPPIISDGGSRIAMDDEIAIRALEWMAEPKQRGVAGPDVDYQGSVAFFSNRSAAFALNGEWEVTTYQAMDLPFGMTTVPTIFDKPANQADSHTFVIPRDPNRPKERLDAALTFISRLVSKGLDWAKGGHVPAYRQIFESERVPQAHAAERLRGGGRAARLRPAGLVLRQRLQPRVQRRRRAEARRSSARSGPEQGLRTFRAYLDRMRKTPRPV